MAEPAPPPGAAGAAAGAPTLLASELPQRYQGVAKDSAGYRLLRSMGWSEGEGLGAEGQGIKSHVRVKRNVESWGVGAAESDARAQDWSAGMAAFHRVLSTLSEVTSEHARANAAAGDSDGEGGGGDASDASRGAPPAGKAARRAAKAARKEAKRRAEEAAAATSEPAPPPRRASHLGRFKRREAAKAAATYSSRDLAAILGEDPFAAAAAEAEAAAAAEAEAAAAVEDAGAASAAPRPAKKARIVVEVALPAAAAPPAAEEPDSPAAGGAPRWWDGYFTRSGRLGALARAAEERRGGFLEEDQEALYTAAQAAKASGKGGLGRSSAPKKVAGAHWAGTRTRIAGSDDEEEPPKAAESDAVVAPAAAPAADALGGVKWRKAAAAALRAAGAAGLRLAKLQRAVAKQLELPKTARAAAAERVAAAVAGSSKFEEAGGVVRLAG